MIIQKYGFLEEPAVPPCCLPLKKQSSGEPGIIQNPSWKKLDFITATGNIYKVVTPLCVFGHRDGKLVLEKIYPYSSLEEIKSNTGFPIIHDEIQPSDPPSEEELEMLNFIDPEKIREIEMR